ncbi:MAG TPA: tetratricopeptide repeat protein [Terriglobales bacterium]|nr:tetratricopeptide repeat protein [Terriglobales bacterium]
MLANSRVSAAQQEPDATRPNAARPSPRERVAGPSVPEMEELQKRFAQARAAKEAGDLPAAARANEKLIALGLREMGKLRMVENAYPEASEFYRRSLELEDIPDAHVNLATAYLLANQLEGSLAEASKVLGSDPRNATIWTVQGEALIRKKDYRAAVESLQRSLALRTDPETSYALASCHLRLKEKEKAAAIFQRMTVAAGERSDLHVLFGIAYRDAHMHDEAIQEFQRALVLNPNAPGVHYLLGLSYLWRNEWAPSPEARREFHKQLELDPGNFGADYMLGYMAFSSYRLSEADRYLAAAAAINPQSAEALLYLGLNAYRGSQNRRAEGLLRKAIAIAEREGVSGHQDIRKAYTTLGRILITSGRGPEAQPYLRKARELEQTIISDDVQGSGVGAGDGSGVTSTTVPNFPQNEPQVSLPPTDGPDVSAPLNPNILSRAKLTTHGEREAKARERYLRSILGASFNDLATAEAIQEQYAAALKHYQDAEHWDATVPNLMRNLGFAAYRAGNRQEAIRALKKALVITPSDNAARDVLKELISSGQWQGPR